MIDFIRIELSYFIPTIRGIQINLCAQHTAQVSFLHVVRHVRVMYHETYMRETGFEKHDVAYRFGG